MNGIERTVRRIDAFQQRHLVTSFAFGLFQKYGNDNGGALAARLTYAGLTTIFPLLLLLVTLLAIVLSDHPGLRSTVLHSAYGEIPVVGRSLASNIHVLKRNSAFGLAVGLVGLAYGVRGIAGVGLQLMEDVWYLPKANRPSFVNRTGRSFVFVAVLGLGLIVTTFLSGVGTFGGHGLPYFIGAEVLAALANIGIYLFAFRILTPKQIESRCLVPGVVTAGILWTVLQGVGTYVVNHYLRDDNAVYGTFGTVLGLVAWFNVAAQMTVFCAELNPYLVRRLWPRGMVQPPMTKADQELAVLQATTNQFRPEVEMEIRVKGRPMSQGEYLARGAQVAPDEFGTTARVRAGGSAPGEGAGGAGGSAPGEAAGGAGGSAPGEGAGGAGGPHPVAGPQEGGPQEGGPQEGGVQTRR